MAVTSTLRGRFVACHSKSWNAFTDQSGAQVAAGSSATVYVETSDSDEPLVIIKNQRDRADEVVAACKLLGFGVEVVGDIEVTRYGHRFVSLKAVNGAAPAGKPAGS